MAKIKTVNLKIPQGTAFQHDFYYVTTARVAIPLTGYTARCHFRDEINSPAFYYEATTENGGLAIDEVNGKISLLVDDAESATWTIYNGVYDIEIIAPNSEPTRIVKGTVTLDPEVTR